MIGGPIKTNLDEWRRIEEKLKARATDKFVPNEYGPGHTEIEQVDDVGPDGEKISTIRRFQLVASGGLLPTYDDDVLNAIFLGETDRGWRVYSDGCASAFYADMWDAIACAMSWAAFDFRYEPETDDGLGFDEWLGWAIENKLKVSQIIGTLLAYVDAQVAQSRSFNRATDYMPGRDDYRRVTRD